VSSLTPGKEIDEKNRKWFGKILKITNRSNPLRSLCKSSLKLLIHEI
jgi:hypothetical protein